MERKNLEGDPIADMPGFTLGPHGVGRSYGDDMSYGDDIPGHVVLKDGKQFKRGGRITIRRDDGDGHTAGVTFPTMEYWHVDSFTPDYTKDNKAKDLLAFSLGPHGIGIWNGNDYPGHIVLKDGELFKDDGDIVIKVDSGVGIDVNSIFPTNEYWHVESFKPDVAGDSPIVDMPVFTLGPHGIGTFDGKHRPGYIVMKDGEEFKDGGHYVIKRDDGNGGDIYGTFPTKEYYWVESFKPDVVESNPIVDMPVFTLGHHGIGGFGIDYFSGHIVLKDGEEFINEGYSVVKLDDVEEGDDLNGTFPTMEYFWADSFIPDAAEGDEIEGMPGFTIGPHGVGLVDEDYFPGHLVLKDGKEFRHIGCPVIKLDDVGGYDIFGIFPTNEYWEVKSFVLDTEKVNEHKEMNIPYKEYGDIVVVDRPVFHQMLGYIQRDYNVTKVDIAER